MANQPVFFKLSASLSKPTTLPNAEKFNIHHEDLLVSDKLLCYNKAKGLLLDHVSPIAERPVSLTRHGYLIIYMEATKGFILDVRRAESISTITDSFKKRRIFHRRCHLKIRFPFGSVNLFILDEKIAEWRRQIGDSFDEIRKETKQTSTEPRTENKSVQCGTLDSMAEEVKESNSSETILSVLRSDTQLSMEEKTNYSSFTTDIEDSYMDPAATVMEVDRRLKKKTVRDAASFRTNKMSDHETFDTLLAGFDKMQSGNKKMTVDNMEKPLYPIFKQVERTSSRNSVRCGPIPVSTFRKHLESLVVKRKEEKEAELALETSNGTNVNVKEQKQSEKVVPCARYAKPLMCPGAASCLSRLDIPASRCQSSPSFFNLPNNTKLEGHFGIKDLAAKFDVPAIKKKNETSGSKCNRNGCFFGRFSLAFPSTSRCESHA